MSPVLPPQPDQGSPEDLCTPRVPSWGRPGGVTHPSWCLAESCWWWMEFGPRGNCSCLLCTPWLKPWSAWGNASQDLQSNTENGFWQEEQMYSQEVKNLWFRDYSTCFLQWICLQRGRAPALSIPKELVLMGSA